MADFTRDICEAVEGRRLLRVRYKDRTRILEPYLIGEYADARRFVLAWLVRCEDDPARTPGWQHYLVAQMQALEVLHEKFDGERDGYNPVSDSRVHHVLCSVPALRRQ